MPLPGILGPLDAIVGHEVDSDDVARVGSGDCPFPEGNPALRTPSPPPGPIIRGIWARRQDFKAT